MALSVCALLPGFFIFALTQYQIRVSRTAEVNDYAIRSAQLASSELERIVSGVESLLTAVSRAQSVREFREPECSAYLGALLPDLPQLVGLTVIDAGGIFRCGSSRPPPGVTFSDRPYIQAALAKGGLSVGGYTIGRGKGMAVLPVVMALQGSDGGRAVIVAGIDLGWLSEQLRQRGVPAGGSITVADASGTIIARQPQPERFVGTRIPEMFLRLLREPAAGVEQIQSQDGVKRVLGYVPLTGSPYPLYVSAGLSYEASYGAVSRAAWTGTLVALLGGVATLAATWFAARRFFVLPVQGVTTVLRKWRAGDRGARTQYKERDGEVGELGAELDRIMDEIARSQEERDLLAGELAHRVKNTLATVQAIATSTLNKMHPAREVLPDYLARISALARTHEVLISERWEGAELRQLIRGVVQPLVADESRVALDGPPVYLPAREALGMTMVVHELCTNALKYGALAAVDGKVEAHWSVTPTADGQDVAMTWREIDGPPVSRPEGGTGFGTRLMGRAFGSAGSAKVEFEPTGIVCRIRLHCGLRDAA